MLYWNVQYALPSSRLLPRALQIYVTVKLPDSGVWKDLSNDVHRAVTREKFWPCWDFLKPKRKPRDSFRPLQLSIFYFCVMGEKERSEVGGLAM